MIHVALLLAVVSSLLFGCATVGKGPDPTPATAGSKAPVAASARSMQDYDPDKSTETAFGFTVTFLKGKVTSILNTRTNTTIPLNWDSLPINISGRIDDVRVYGGGTLVLLVLYENPTRYCFIDPVTKMKVCV
jgi:hypothetical protein